MGYITAIMPRVEMGGITPSGTGDLTPQSPSSLRESRPWKVLGRRGANPLTSIRDGLKNPDPTVRRKTQLGVALKAAFILGAAAFGAAGCDFMDDGGAGEGGGEGDTPPANDPRPGYTGPSDECWELYDNALQHGSVPEADAQALVNCGYENPGYFEYHRMPVISSETGKELGIVSFGDRPPH